MDPGSGAVSPFLSTTLAADFLGLKPSTLERWRCAGEGPVFHKIGGRIYYTRPDLQTWIESRRRRSTAEHKARSSGEVSRQRME
jgi:predicted site-specific integrase-resolvase